jgi:hypothetical protein
MAEVTGKGNTTASEALFFTVGITDTGTRRVPETHCGTKARERRNQEDHMQ